MQCNQLDCGVQQAETACLYTRKGEIPLEKMSSIDIILAILYGLALVYCFLGLSAITARFFHGMENIVLQTREVSFQDPDTGRQVVKQQRVWNYAVADITLLAFGTSFPQISLATIDAFLNLGNLYAGGIFLID